MMSDQQHPDMPAESFTAFNVSVYDTGRFTIPARFRNRFGIEDGDIVDVAVDVGETTMIALDLPVVDGKVRIPATKRTLYGIEGGGEYDIEISATGMSLPDDGM